MMSVYRRNPRWRKREEWERIYPAAKSFSDKEYVLFVGICGLLPKLLSGLG